MKFEINAEQLDKIKIWSICQDDVVYKKQLISEDPIIKDMAETYGHAYYGAIGGSLTYSFTPTSIGEIVTVKHSGTDAELDIIDYNNW